VSALGVVPVVEIHSLAISDVGGHVADLTLATSALPALDVAPLDVGDLRLVGRIVIAGHDDHPGGARARVIHRGGAGWYAPLARGGSYVATGGVRLSTVLRDLAAAAGERYDAPLDALLPARYRWPAPAPGAPLVPADVLADLRARRAIATWRIDPDTGRATFAPWPRATCGAHVIDRDLASARRSLALDTRVRQVLPGSVVEGATIRRVLITETSQSMRAEVWS
jgi:hypothetical protein